MENDELFVYGINQSHLRGSIKLKAAVWVLVEYIGAYKDLVRLHKDYWKRREARKSRTDGLMNAIFTDRKDRTHQKLSL